MVDNMYICPICKQEIKRGNGHHIRKCLDNYVLNMSDDLKDEYKHYYIDEQYSIADMSTKFNFPSTVIYGILKRLNIKTRTIKESRLTQRVKKKYESTCMQHFGCSHNFSKDSESRKQWEKRLYEEEGITNVFQRKDVKEKIQNTLYNSYGKDAHKIINSKQHVINKWIKKYNLTFEQAEEKWNITQFNKGNGMRLSYYITKYGYDNGYKKYISMLQQKSNTKSNCISSLNIKFKNMLDELNIQYIQEFPIQYNENQIPKFLYYDFKIDNVIFELNGTYWHASPKVYKQEDIIHYPNNIQIQAKNIWEKDEFKKDLAELYGYKVIYFWEDEINDINKWNNIINLFKIYAEYKNKIN